MSLYIQLAIKKSEITKNRAKSILIQKSKSLSGLVEDYFTREEWSFICDVMTYYPHNVSAIDVVKDISNGVLKTVDIGKIRKDCEGISRESTYGWATDRELIRFLEDSNQLEKYSVVLEVN